MTIKLEGPTYVLEAKSFAIDPGQDQLTEMTAADYVIHYWREPGIIVPAWNVTWPAARIVPGSIQVTYTAGYPAGSPPGDQETQEAMPALLRTWMEARLATLFENREQVIVGHTVNPLPQDFVDGLLDSLVVGTRLF